MIRDKDSHIFVWDQLKKKKTFDIQADRQTEWQEKSDETNKPDQKLKRKILLHKKFNFN